MRGFTFLIAVCTLILLGCQSSVAQDEQEECPLNEEDVECVNACNICKVKNETCQTTGECVQGCDCKKGFLRNKFGYCIPKRFCGKQSPGDYVAGDGRQRSADHGGCPNLRKCNLSCRKRGFQRGNCIGSRSRRCQCFRRTTEDRACPLGRCFGGCYRTVLPGGRCGCMCPEED